MQVPVLRLKQDGLEFEASLRYNGSCCLKRKLSRIGNSRSSLVTKFDTNLGYMRLSQRKLSPTP